MKSKVAPKKIAPLKKAAPKKAAPKKTATSKKTEAKEVTAIPHGNDFLVTETTPDGGVWKQSIESENPLEGEE